MGTRSIINVYDESEKILSLYGQYDGYPSGVGRDLADFLNGMQLVNGISIGENKRIANGMGCLAAQLVCNFKKTPGSFYIVSCKDFDHWQEYTYDLYAEKVRVMNYSGEVIFLGSWKDFSDFCNDDDA